MAAQWPSHNGLQVTIKRADGTPYPLVAHGGKLIIVGEPGDVFTVAVNRSADDGHLYDETMLVRGVPGVAFGSINRGTE